MTAVARDGYDVKAAGALVKTGMPVDVFEGSLYQFLLFALINTFGSATETRVFSIANLNKNQLSGLFHDQVYFAIPTVIVALQKF